MFRRTAGVIAGSLALVVGLGGCSLLNSDGDAAPISGLAACALGHTWQLDTADFATKIKDDLYYEGVPADVQVAGSQTLEWSDVGRVIMTSDLTMTAVVAVTPEFVVTVTKTQTGTVTGAAYITGEVAIPRDWDESELTVSTKAESGGSEMADGSPWTIPKLGIDDSVGLELTCDGDKLTIHPRGERTVQVWMKAS